MVSIRCFPPERSESTRPYPNLHPLIARQLGIHLMYAPPLRPARRMLMPIRPLVVRYTHSFPEPCCIRIQICPYLPDEQFGDAARIITALSGVSGLKAMTAKADSPLRGPVWDTEKITAHHAIVPPITRTCSSGIR